MNDGANTDIRPKVPAVQVPEDSLATDVRRSNDGITGIEGLKPLEQKDG